MTADDVVEHRLDGDAIGAETRPLYYERYIHAGVYAANPLVQSVIHSHADDVLPFALADEPLRVVMISAKALGTTFPVWDVVERFGDATDMLVSDLERVKALSTAEIATGIQLPAESYGRQRAWEYWSHRVGVPYRPGAFARSSALR